MALVARIGDDGRGEQAALGARLRTALEHAAVPAVHAAPLRLVLRVFDVPGGRVLVLGAPGAPGVLARAGAPGAPLGPAVHVASFADAEALVSLVHDARPRLGLVLEGTVLWRAKFDPANPNANAAERYCTNGAFHVAHAGVSHAQSGAPLGFVFAVGASSDGRTPDELAEDVLEPGRFPGFAAALRGDSLLHSLLLCAAHLL